MSTRLIIKTKTICLNENEKCNAQVEKIKKHSDNKNKKSNGLYIFSLRNGFYILSLICHESIP